MAIPVSLVFVRNNILKVDSLSGIRQPLYADELLEDLRYTLPKAGATVSNVYSDIRIISGDWEGRYAWISVNYLAKKLGNAGVNQVFYGVPEKCPGYLLAKINSS
nr:unnamed protein product [Spirometra erinaceieuropaei]